MNSPMTSQLQCFSVISSALEATIEMIDGHDFDPEQIPSILFHQVIHRVRLNREVAIRHGCIAEDTLSITLQHGGLVLEFKIRCDRAGLERALSMELCVNVSSAKIWKLLSSSPVACSC